MEALKKNQEYTVSIDGYSAEGLGVCRIGGQVVFVQGALRGETCVVQLLKVRKNIAFAKVLRVLIPSPARQVPDCPHFPQCGGCQLRHMSYEEELWFKRRKVEDALRRIGGVEIELEEILGSEQTLRYRNKSQFPVGPDGSIGFYRARSHQVIPVTDCLLQSETANTLAAAVGQYMARCQVSGYDEAARRGLVRHIYVRTNAQGEALVCLAVNGRALPQEETLTALLRECCPGLVGVVLNENREDTNVILGRQYRTLWGASTLTDTLCGHRFMLSIPAFYQVNRSQAERLYGKALEYAGLTGCETVLELYCGAGTITLTVAPHARQVIGAEIVPEAVENAKANAAANGIRNARFFLGDAGEAAEKFGKEGLHAQVVVVDPPRKGLGEEVIRTVVQLAPERVVYVSCDSATLARDVRRFGELGYRLQKAVAVDMFPRTMHVETVVLLSKGEIDSQKVRVEFSLEDMDMSGFRKGATYDEIKAYVLEKFGLKVSSLYISQVKRKCGLEVGENYNLPKAEGTKQPQCPPEKEKAIHVALAHFGII